jgi:16S rRNA G1207 methylase RsmC
MSHYYTKKQDSEFKIFKIEDVVRDFNIELYSSSGVFSKKRIDKGTKILAENMVIGKNDKVLDMGCGIGVVGFIAAKITKNKVLS